MGSIQSTIIDRFSFRREAGVQEVDISTNNAYRYPPKSGNYFASHFIMGGQRFDAPQPEAYLFGDNSDLNFLGNRPVPFPYPAPQTGEPTKTLKSLVNIRKDSIRFIRNKDDEQPPTEGDETQSSQYNIEFTFDSNVKCAITVHCFATEEIRDGLFSYTSKLASETVHYKQGSNQVFSQTTFIVEPSLYDDSEWLYNTDKEEIPVVIHCEVEDEAHLCHSHVTFATVEKTSDSEYQLKPLKQKQMIDGLSYLLQEIYGIENKSLTQANKLDADDGEFDENGSECVICMCDTRDTLILPCRHLCLCNGCADNLRYQSNNCPICRSPFIALLHIRALKKKTTTTSLSLPQGDVTTEEGAVSQEGVPPGYEAVSLIEALNGPQMTPTPLPMKPTLPPITSSPKERTRRKKRSSKSRKPAPADACVLEEANEEVHEEIEFPRASSATSRRDCATPDSQAKLEMISEVVTDRDTKADGDNTELDEDKAPLQSISEVEDEVLDNNEHITIPHPLDTIKNPLMDGTVVLSEVEDEETSLMHNGPQSDGLSLPGTPLESRDGSTYSTGSSGSTRGLLTGVTAKIDSASKMN